MISSREDILPLFREWLITQHENTYCEWSGKYLNGWDNKRRAKYFNGIAWGKLREHDPNTMKTLKIGVYDDALRSEIKIYLEREIVKYKQLEQDDPTHVINLMLNENQLGELKQVSTDEWIKNNCGWMKEYSLDINYQEFRVILYLSYAFSNYIYDMKYAPYESSVSNLDFCDHQFIKYGLVPIDEQRAIELISPPRIYDKYYDKTFFIKNVPLHLLKVFDTMMSDGNIQNLAIRLINDPGYPGDVNLDYITEEIERGKIFDFVNLGAYSVSRLYSDNYNDCLWVAIDNENITFEELCDDFEISDNMIVTQVIHLQYHGNGAEASITHLDHEYIFYTPDEYEKRLKDPRQKGTARPRMKSFKIDNSNIPFNYRCENKRKDTEGNELPVEHEQFLLYVLECYFKHKDLLREYFDKVI